MILKIRRGGSAGPKVSNCVGQDDQSKRQNKIEQYNINNHICIEKSP